MCQDAYNLVLEKGVHDLEIQMTLQCAPLFGRLKLSNLLITDHDNLPAVRRILEMTDISHFMLYTDGKRLELLLFRANELWDYLQQREVQKLFRENGYETASLASMLMQFRQHYVSYKQGLISFPHEMGLLLGYPVEDVLGFICNQGRGSLFSGYWKVYGHLQKKKKLFRQFELAEQRLARLLSEGNSMTQVLQMYKNELQSAAI